MSTIHVTAHLAIHDGKLDAFLSNADKCMEIVRDKDTGTLQYDWFLNPDKTACAVREQYRDSAAVFEHITNLGDTLGELLATCDMALEVCGDVSPELRGALAQMDAKVYGPLKGA